MKEKLLPNYFKKIGFILGILAFIFLLKDDLFPAIQTYNWIASDILLASMLMIAFSREKIETEEVKLLRYKYLKSSLLFGGLFWILKSIISLISNSKTHHFNSGDNILFLILIWYVISFNFQKYLIDQARA